MRDKNSSTQSRFFYGNYIGVSTEKCVLDILIVILNGNYIAVSTK